MRIKTGSTVELKYEVYTSEGELFESSGEEAVEFVQGQGHVIPGIEKALEGKESGAELDLTCSAEDAYGDYDPAGLVSVPRSELPTDAEITPGDWITVVVQSDDGEEPDELEMRIVEADGDEVILDGNHPLAGQEVRFRLKVVSVR